MPKSINVRIYPQEEEVINKMKEKGLPVNELIRGFLREYGDKHFPTPPPYAEALLLRAKIAYKKHATNEEIENMSNEDYATKVLRGKIVKDRVWFVNPNQTFDLSLEKIKKVPVEDEWIRQHMELLDNLNPNISPEWREKMLKEWQDA